MATVATHLKPNLKSTYNLWKLLSNGDTVTCYYLHIPKRAYNENYAMGVDTPKKDAAQAIATWLNANVASFTYTVLTLADGYTPNWCGSPDLELIHKASEGSFDKLFRNYQPICYLSFQILGFRFEKHMFLEEPLIMKSLLLKSRFIRQIMQHIAELKRMVLGMLIVTPSIQAGLRKVRQDITS